MKDFFGITLKVGDTVAFTKKETTELILGKVEKVYEDERTGGSLAIGYIDESVDLFVEGIRQPSVYVTFARKVIKKSRK